LPRARATGFDAVLVAEDTFEAVVSTSTPTGADAWSSARVTVRVAAEAGLVAVCTVEVVAPTTPCTVAGALSRTGIADWLAKLDEALAAGCAGSIAVGLPLESAAVELATVVTAWATCVTGVTGDAAASDGPGANVGSDWPTAELAGEALAVWAGLVTVPVDGGAAELTTVEVG
jgi:hypothetical protein